MGMNVRLQILLLHSAVGARARVRARSAGGWMRACTGARVHRCHCAHCEHVHSTARAHQARPRPHRFHTLHRDAYLQEHICLGPWPPPSRRRPKCTMLLSPLLLLRMPSLRRWSRCVRVRPALSASACTRTHAQMQTLPAYCEVQRWGQASHRIPESIPICVAHVTDARRPTRQRAYHCACSPSSVRWTSARTSSL